MTTNGKRKIATILCILTATAFLCPRSRAADMGDAPLRDYSVALPLPAGRLEAGIDFLRIDDNIDIFNTREIESSDDQNDENVSYLGDMTGYRAYANYGLFSETVLHSSAISRELELGSDTLEIFSCDISAKQTLFNKKYGDLPVLAADFGLRMAFLDEPGQKAKNYTPFARLTTGKMIADFFPNVFVEYGHTRIESETGEDLSGESGDGDRNENQVRAGACLLFKMPYTAMMRLEYNFIRLFREDGLDGVDDNHVMKSDVNWFIDERFVLNLGFVYYHRQFNGEIPLLYGESAQTDFGRYLRGHVGIVFLFGGE